MRGDWGLGNMNQATASDMPQVELCPDCGYSLWGLPSQGTCPECGFRYDQQMIVLYGWRPDQGQIVGAILSSQQIAVLLLWAALGAVAVAFVPGGPVVTVALAMAWGTCIVLLSRRYFLISTAEAPPAPCQLRLCQQGFAWRVGFGRVKLKPWSTRPPSGLIWMLIRNLRGRPPAITKSLLFMREGVASGGQRVPGQYHFCISTGMFGGAGDCADVVVDLQPEVAESIRRRAQTWEILATPQQAGRFWLEYRVPSAGT